MAARVTPLRVQHEVLGARFTEFGGWEMPVQYSGVVDEHLTVRQACGLFDLSHMGEINIVGPMALDFVQYVMSNDVHKLAPGRAQYTLLCNESGGIIDDLLVYRHADCVTLAVNASNTGKDLEWLRSLADKPPYRGSVDIVNVGEERAILAVQGPKAPKAMQAVGLDVTDLSYMSFRLMGDDGQMMVSRTGYTGEIGYELYLPKEKANHWWDRFMGVAGTVGIKPVGLGARDTLRLEMGYTLYGNDIDESTNPWEAGIGWAVKLGKDFIGRASLAESKAKGLERRLVGFQVEGRGIARSGYSITINGQVRGRVTSGSISPSLNVPIGLAYMDEAVSQEGTAIEVIIRGRPVTARIVQVPFMPSRVKDVVVTE